MFEGLHLLAGASSITNGAVFATVGTVVDQFFTQATNGYLRGESYRVVGAYVRGDSMTDARINSPSLRNFGPPVLDRFDTAATPPNLPPFNDCGGNGVVLVGNEAFNVELSRAGAGASVCQYGLWLGKSPPVEYKGNVRTIRATASITLTTSSWVTGTLTLGTTLPYGNYDIVGMDAYGTGLLFARIAFPDRANKPGCLAQQAVGEYGWSYFRNGNLGRWGTFNSNALPTIECFGFSAGASSIVVNLDLVQVG